MMGGPVFSLTVAPNGMQAAVSEMKRDKEILAQEPMARIVFAKAGRTETVTSAYEFRSTTVVTGAGDFMQEPAFSWLDNETLLFVGYATDGSEFHRGKFVRTLPIGGESMRVAKINSADGTHADLCGIPKCFDPRFVETPFPKNGRALVMVPRLGLYEVDAATGELNETSAWQNSLRLVGKPERLALKFEGEVIEPNFGLNLSLLEPNGNRIVWQSSNLRFGNVPFHPNREESLYVFDPIHGKRLAYEGTVWLTQSTSTQPALPLFFWTNDEELASAKHLEKFPSFATKQPTRRVDTRPAIDDCIEIELQTKKATYQRHEPVELQLKIKNLTANPYRFESSRVVQNSMPFQLESKHQRGRESFHVFDRDQNQPAEDFVEIPPAGTLTLDRTIEIAKTGQQNLEFKIESYGDWRGYLTSSSSIEVLESTSAELLRQKFDRLLAKCLRQWQGPDGGGLPAHEFWPLGEAGAELLVGHLRTCEDGQLRQALGDGLRSSTSESTLDYFAARLKTDMKDDHQSIIRCLANCVSRARWKRDVQAAARSAELLKSTMNHPSQLVRFEAIRRIAKALPDDADEIMIEATSDPDKKIATMAARYVAVRQQLSLKQWLEYALGHPGPATNLALRSFAKNLANQWDYEYGFSDLEMELDSRYPEAIEDLIQWCEKNPRTSDEFFESVSLRVIENRTLPIERQAGPIKLAE